MSEFQASNVVLNAKVFECILCKKVLSDPVQLNKCGHKICFVCSKKSLSNFDPSPKCPACFVELSEPNHYRDGELRREIGLLNMRCPGCLREFQMSAFWEDHAATCPGLGDGFVLVHCERCKRMIYQHQLMTHNKLKCEMANPYPVDVSAILLPDNYPTRYQCAECLELMRLEYQCHNGHRLCSNCINEDLDCPVGGCGEPHCFLDKAIGLDAEFKCSRVDCQKPLEWEQIRPHEAHCIHIPKRLQMQRGVLPVQVEEQGVVAQPLAVEPQGVAVEEQGVVAQPLAVEPQGEGQVRCRTCNRLIQIADRDVHELECQGMQPL